MKSKKDRLLLRGLKELLNTAKELDELKESIEIAEIEEQLIELKERRTSLRDKS